MGKQPGHSLRAPLRHRDFRLLMTGYSVSAAGSWAYNVGLAVYVYQQTRSASWVGAVTLGRFIPSVVFGSYAGVLAERFERVKLMVFVDLICAALMSALTVAAIVHAPALLAIALGATNSVVYMTYQPAVSALTPQLVPESDLASANTLSSTVNNLATVAGPGIGAGLLLLGSPAFAFGANAVSFVWSASMVSRLLTRSAPVDVSGGGEVSPLRQMLVGAQTIFSSSTATVLAAYSVVASFVYGTDTVLFVIVSERRLGTGANGYSYLLAGLGLGGLLGAGLVKRVSAWPRLGTAILVAMGVFCLPTLALAFIREAPAAFAVEVVRGAGTLVVDVLAMTSLQRSLPKDKLARVFGAFFTFVLIAISLGALITPQVLALAGLRTTLVLAATVVPALCLLGWPMLRRMDQANVETLALITPRVALLQRAAMFSGASNPALEQLAKSATTLDVGAGQDVVRDGEEADALYVIESGAMSVESRGTGQGALVALADLGPGDYFGEIGLLNHIPRTATVRASSDATLLRIDGQAFLDAMSAGFTSESLHEGAAYRLARTPLYAPPPAGSSEAVATATT